MWKRLQIVMSSGRESDTWNQEGNVLVIVAVTIPILLIIIALLIDTGYSYVIRAELQTTADMSASAGSAYVADRAVEEADAYIASGVPETSDDPFDYLSTAEIESIAAEAGAESQAQEYCTDNAAAMNAEYEVICEFDIVVSSDDIRVTIEAERTIEPLIPFYSGDERTITAESVSLLPLP